MINFLGICEDKSNTYVNEVITYYDNIVKKELSNGESRLYKVVNQKEKYIENTTNPGLTIIDAYEMQKHSLQQDNSNKKLFLLINITFLLILILSYSVIKSLRKMKKNSVYIFLGIKKGLVVWDNLKENALPILLTILLGYLMGLIILLLNYNSLKIFTSISITPLSVVLTLLILIILVLVINIFLSINIFFTSPITLIKNSLKDK